MGIKIRLKQLNEGGLNGTKSMKRALDGVADETKETELNTQISIDSSTRVHIDKNDIDYQLYSKFIERLNQNS